jgi:hypothetical protein
VYLATVHASGDAEEGVALLSEAFTLPAEYFDLGVVDCSDAEDWIEDGDPFRAFAGQHGERTVTMTADELQLMHQKMQVFWTGMRAEP